jgi:hypothetical protein
MTNSKVVKLSRQLGGGEKDTGDWEDRSPEALYECLLLVGVGCSIWQLGIERLDKGGKDTSSEVWALIRAHQKGSDRGSSTEEDANFDEELLQGANSNCRGRGFAGTDKSPSAEGVNDSTIVFIAMNIACDSSRTSKVHV